MMNQLIARMRGSAALRTGRCLAAAGTRVDARRVEADRPRFEALEPRLLLSSTLLADAGPDQTVDEGDTVQFAGSFTDTGGGGTPGTFDITQVTDNTTADGGTNLQDQDNGRAVWVGGNNELFFFDGTFTAGDPNIITLGTAGTTKAEPKISGDHIAWFDSSSGGLELYTISTGTQVTVSGSVGTKSNLNLDGGTLVWQQGNRAVMADATAATPTAAEVDPAFVGNMTDVRFDGRDVAWRGGGNGGFLDVYLHNLDNGVTANASNTPFTDLAPSLDDGGLAWIATDTSSNRDVFYVDARDFGVTGTLPAPVQLDSVAGAADGFDTAGTVSGANVAWLNADTTSDRQIYHFNVDTGLLTNVTSDLTPVDDTATPIALPSNPGTLALSGASLVAANTSASSSDVFVYDLDSIDNTLNQITATPLTDTPDSDVGPQIEGNTILWRSRANQFDDFEIFLAVGAANVTYSFDWDFGDGTVVTDTTLDPTHVYSDDGTFTATLTVTASDGRVATDDVLITVNNVAPTAGPLVLDSSVIDENGTVNLSGSFTDPGADDTHTVVIDWGDGTTSNAVVDQLAGTFTASHQYLDDTPSGTASDDLPITVTVTDDDLDADTATTTVTVNNVAPTVASLTGPTQAVRGQTLSYNASFSDAGTLDTHTTEWLVLDSSSATVATGTGLSFDFTPTTLDTFTVQFTVTDDDTGAASQSLSLATSAVLVDADPANPGQTAVFVGGSQTNSNTIKVKGGSTAGTIKVVLRDNVTGAQQAFDNLVADRVVAYGGDSNDFIKAFNSLGTTPVEFFGGGATDWLRGGQGDDILNGGAGWDLIAGRDGRDFLLGGTGTDLVVGHQEDDILVGGVYENDTDRNALAAIMAEWTRTDLGYNDRVSNLQNGGGLNGSFLLNGSTVFDDDEIDLLFGLQGQDYFLAGSSDFTDKKRNEELTLSEQDYVDLEDDEADNA